jgi:ribosomal protein S27AE
VAKKKYDPLWEIVHEKVALQCQGPDVNVPCPHCNVTVHLKEDVRARERFACGLCGGVSEVVAGSEGPGLRAVER